MDPLIQFDGPMHIPYEMTARFVWGDELSGEVSDWIYLSNQALAQLVFGLPSGAAFRHSDNFQTVFAADEVYYVLSGILVLNNPETGEVHRLQPGEAAFFRRDTWHHGFSYGTEPLRVLEYFAPPPAQGAGADYARTKSRLTEIKYSQDQWLSRWPFAQIEARQNFTIQVLTPSDILWRLEGQNSQALVGILASSEHLTVGKVYLLPSQQTDIQIHGGDEGLYLLEGSLNIHLPDSSRQRWFELKPGDGFYIPTGAPHQYYNLSDRSACLIFGVAPHYVARNP